MRVAAKATNNSIFAENKRAMRLIFSSLFIFTLVFANAQDYVVTLQRDTLRGDIDILLPSTYSEDITVQTDQDKKRFKVFQFLMFRKDSVTYHPVKHQDKYRIMRLEKAGYLSLYSFRFDESHEFGTKYLYKKTQEGIEVPNILFKQHMRTFLSDCEIVATKIDDKDLKKKDLLTIIDEYNTCIQSSSKQVLNEETPLVQLINELINKSKNEEYQTLLKDVKSKLKSGETIPNYMISALENTGESSTEKDELINELKNQ